MDAQQILALVGEMIDSGEIGLYPRSNSNGADSIVCPSCFRSTAIKGYAGGMEHLNAGEHAPDCRAVKLMQLLDRS